MCQLNLSETFILFTFDSTSATGHCDTPITYHSIMLLLPREAVGGIWVIQMSPAPPRISLCALLTREDWWRLTAATVLIRHLDLGPIGNAWRTIQGYPYCHVRWSTQIASLIIVIHRLLTVMFLDLSLCLSCLSTTDRCWRLTASHQCRHEHHFHSFP